MKGTFHIDEEVEITLEGTHWYKGLAALTIDYDVPTAELREDRIAPSQVSVTRAVLRFAATFLEEGTDLSVTFSPGLDITEFVEHSYWTRWAEAIASHYTETDISERF